MNPVPTRRIVSMKLVFSLVTVALVGLTVVGVFLITERNARRALQSEMEMRLVLEARHLALLSADALLAEYPELTLCPIVREMMQRRPYLTVAVVTDHEGRIQGHPDVRRLGEYFPMLETFTPYATHSRLQDDEAMLANEELMAARVPARHPGGQVVGTVLVAQDRGHISVMLARGRRQVALLAGALAVAGVILSLVVVRWLLAPLDTLRAGLTRIGRGDLDSPIQLKNGTELGLLGDTIDNMAIQLKQSRAETRAKEMEIIATQREVIHTLGEVVESRSYETGNHIDRVAEGAALLAELAGLNRRQCELLRMAAPMHDVGKIGIPDAILNKPGVLTVDEYEVIKTHAELGHRILSQSDRPILRAAAIVAHEHHEHWDGNGYPRRLAGEEIHIFGRIVTIVDVFDALTSDRCYRPAMQLAEALAIMTAKRGSHFDPELYDLFIQNLDRFRECMKHRRQVSPLLAGAGDPVPEAPTGAAESVDADARQTSEPPALVH
jgi:response regulator RpfG family c-di-GMP phosphodiesterase